MKTRLLEILLAVVLGFFTGVLLSGGGVDISESGIHILLGCILWVLILNYLHSSTNKSE
ncbi:hypothetical protein [Paenibacillus pabuli]|uniref:hypothetical protein n=1 Tax=Paenibacillus pabuli TaxID=1472 RepID=UPI003CE80FF0